MESVKNSEIKNKIQKKDLYTTAEAAACLNVFSTTVINWISKGYLNCFRTPGGHRKIPKEELLSFVDRYDFYRNLREEKKSKILIIEDDDDARNLCLSIFSDKYDVKAVENGYFSGVVRDFKPDIVLLDVMLPDIDGEDICRFIKSDEELKNTKIFAVSAINDENKIDRLFKAGITSFIGKPYKVEFLEKKVEDALRDVA